MSGPHEHFLVFPPPIASPLAGGLYVYSPSGSMLKGVQFLTNEYKLANIVGEAKYEQNIKRFGG